MSAVLNTDDKEGKSAGTILRETRESRGLSLDDAARVTRIGKTHLHALEEGIYDRLPSEVYIKGFLRVYAAYLKLPENVVLGAYEKDLSGDGANAVDQEPQPRIEEKNVAKPPERSKWMYLVPAILVLVAVSSYLLISAPFTKNGSKVQFPAVSSSAKPAISAASPVKNVDEAADARQQEKAGNEKQDENTEIFDGSSPSPQGMVLKIKVIEDGWLDITIDDAVTQHYELKSGDLIEWKGEKSFTLDIGNAGGVEAELDGKALKPFGKSGETTHVLFKAGDEKVDR